MTRWQQEGQLKLTETAVIPRGTQSEKGLDVFTLTHYDPETQLVRSEKGGLVKKNDWPKVHESNNPIKTLDSWRNWYFRTTGSQVPVGALMNPSQPITISEFNNLIKGQQPNQTWTEVSKQLEKNLEQVKGNPVEELWSQPLHFGELDRQKHNNNIGRRVIIVGGRDPEPSFIFQGRTYAATPERATKKEGDIWRAYLEVEVEDIPQMVSILDELGTKISAEGGCLDSSILLVHFHQIHLISRLVSTHS